MTIHQENNRADFREKVPWMSYVVKAMSISALLLSVMVILYYVILTIITVLK